jgi:hypothetical protein
MSNIAPNVVEKRVWLSVEHAGRLSRLAQVHQIREDRIVEKALDAIYDNWRELYEVPAR